jgi:DNA-binding transcriptional MerR regulator
VQEYPQKEFYKLNEVCRYTDTQPYVLRFWESEFPQLNPERGGNGQPVYSKEDIDMVRRIKQLLYEEECSLEVARQALDGDKSGGSSAGTQSKPRATAETSVKATETPKATPVREVEVEVEVEAAPTPWQGSGSDLVPRQRYEDAVEEVHHLRRQLEDAETACRKAENSLQEAGGEAERYRLKAVKAGRRIEDLLETLS